MSQIPNAYVRFFKSASDSIKKENPELKNVEVIDEIAKRWKNMDSVQRQPYEDAAQKDVDAENQRIANLAAKRTEDPNIRKKVYVVFTIETCDSGENFIMERVFSSSKGIDAYKYKFESEFKYNTEYYSKKGEYDLKWNADDYIVKDKTEWESELNKLLPELNKENLSDISKKLEAHRFKFSTSKKDKNAVDLPTFATHVKIMTIDNDNDSEKKEYCYC